MRWQPVLLVCALQQAYAKGVYGPEYGMLATSLWALIARDDVGCVRSVRMLRGLRFALSFPEEVSLYTGSSRCSIDRFFLSIVLVLDLDTCLQNPDFYFMCASDSCTLQSWVCDGVLDCKGGSDETLCNSKFSEIN